MKMSSRNNPLVKLASQANTRVAGIRLAIPSRDALVGHFRMGNARGGIAKVMALAKRRLK